MIPNYQKIVGFLYMRQSEIQLSVSNLSDLVQDESFGSCCSRKSIPHILFAAHKSSISWLPWWFGVRLYLQHLLRYLPPHLYGNWTLLFGINIYLPSSTSETCLFHHILPEVDWGLPGPRCSFGLDYISFLCQSSNLHEIRTALSFLTTMTAFWYSSSNTFAFPFASLHNRGSWLSN